MTRLEPYNESLRAEKNERNRHFQSSLVSRKVPVTTVLEMAEFTFCDSLEPSYVTTATARMLENYKSVIREQQKSSEMCCHWQVENVLMFEEYSLSITKSSSNDDEGVFKCSDCHTRVNFSLKQFEGYMLLESCTFLTRNQRISAESDLDEFHLKLYLSQHTGEFL